MKKHQDIFIGIGILIFCITAAVFSMQLNDGSEVMPLVLTSGMAVSGVFVIMGGIKKTANSRKNSDEIQPLITLSSLKVPGIMYLQVVFYAISFHFVGLYAATLFFMAVSMRYLKQKSWLTIVLLAVGFLGFTYFFLDQVLNVSIDPLGALGPWLGAHS